MLNQLLHDDLAQALINAQNSPTWARAKRLLLVMLAVWLSYFLLVNWFVHSLNKIAVPVIGIPLGDLPGRAGRRDRVCGHAVPFRP